MPGGKELHPRAFHFAESTSRASRRDRSCKSWITTPKALWFERSASDTPHFVGHEGTRLSSPPSSSITQSMLTSCISRVIGFRLPFRQRRLTIQVAGLICLPFSNSGRSICLVLQLVQLTLLSVHCCVVRFWFGVAQLALSTLQAPAPSLWTVRQKFLESNNAFRSTSRNAT